MNQRLGQDPHEQASARCQGVAQGSPRCQGSKDCTPDRPLPRRLFLAATREPCFNSAVAHTRCATPHRAPGHPGYTDRCERGPDDRFSSRDDPEGTWSCEFVGREQSDNAGKPRHDRIQEIHDFTAGEARIRRADAGSAKGIFVSLHRREADRDADRADREGDASDLRRTRVSGAAIDPDFGHRVSVSGQESASAK